jgi:hypothetical protein
LTKHETAKWHTAVNEFIALREFKVPRYITCDDEFKRIYMLATDASADAIGAIIHSISLSLSGKHKAVFLMAKTKLLTPLSKRKPLGEGGG